jgi:hypothetical protein
MRERCGRLESNKRAMRYDDPPRFEGDEKGPVILPAFKAGDPGLRGPDGGFDSHTSPPTIQNS